MREYSVVDPERDVIDVYRNTAESFEHPISVARTDVLTTPLLSNFELPLDRVLA